MTERIFNFSAGPAVLPLPVLEQAQREMLALPGVGMSILEVSHRSPPFESVLAQAKQNLTELLNIPANYRILFLQGGSRLQFSMVPMNLLTESNRAADYILTGSWGKQAIAEAVREGTINVAWDGKSEKYNRLPRQDELSLDKNAAFVHITSNETIEGVQFASEPEVGNVPLVCDASSDFMHRPLPIEKYGLIYACAQKNAGPAGVTIVIIRDDLLARGSDKLPGYLNYRNHAEGDSMWNTPPTFAIYIVELVTRWLRDEVGGLAAMHERNKQKAKMIYDAIDSSNGFYSGHAVPANRSLMNATFRLPSEELEKAFLKGAEAANLSGLKGHRSVGGMRASIYNAMPVEGVTALRDYMQAFVKQHS